MAKIYPERLRWFNEKELIDWLTDRRELEDSYLKACVYDSIIDCLYQMHNAEHTITIVLRTGDSTLEEVTDLIKTKSNHTCINCQYYEPDVKYCEKLESDNIEYNYRCGYWKETEDG